MTGVKDERLLIKEEERTDKNKGSNLLPPLHHPDRAPVKRHTGPRGKTNKQAIKEIMRMKASKFPDKSIRKMAKEYNEQHGTNVDVRELMQFIQIKKAIMTGDTSAYTAVQDREEGKPKQVQENLNLDISFEDFLDRAADPEVLDSSASDDNDKITGGHDGT